MTDPAAPPVPDLDELERLADEADGCTFVFQLGSRSDRYLAALAKAGHWLLAQAREAERLRADNSALRERLALHPDGACSCHGEGTCTWCHYSRASEDLTAALRLLSEHKIHPDSRELAQAFDSAAEEAMRLDQLESAIRPLLGTREATPENVAEVVGHYVEARAVLHEGEVETWCSDRAVRWLSADAARSEPEERE